MNAMNVMTRLIPLMLLASVWFVTNCSDSSKPCKDASECAANQVCEGGTCKAKTSSGENNTTTDGGGSDEPVLPPCALDKECEKGKICKDKKCQPTPETCKEDKECGTELVCDPQNKKCERKRCRLDDDCPTGQSCDTKTDGGRCIPSKECSKNDDCPNNWVCNTCRKVCTVSLGTDKCQEDFNCVSMGGRDLAWCDKCLGECRARLKICEPCSKDDECGEETDHCIPDILQPESGKKFCGRACYQNTFCPAGFKCQLLDATKYKNPYQCVPASGDCAKPGECENDAACAASNKICDPRTKLCVKGCQVNENCPVQTAGPCKQDADCNNAQAKCLNGICNVQLTCCRGQCGRPCTGDSECERNEKCDGGCCKVDNECRTSRDCKKGEYCDTTLRLCKEGCQVPNDCGLPDPQKQRCRFECVNNKCVEDCKCRNPHLDCPAVRFCPLDQTDPNAACRKPIGPVCKSCAADTDCGCKTGDDCKFICTRKTCSADTDCKDLPGGANSCYNGRCSTKKVCRIDRDCPPGEKCENGKCGENCNNRCVQLQSGARCFTGCDPLGDGSECPSRLSCIELLPQSATGPDCEGAKTRCTSDSDCSGKQPRCGEDGYCTGCAQGKVCRNLDPRDPLKLICIDAPPTVCGALGGDLCADGGF